MRKGFYAGGQWHDTGFHTLPAYPSERHLPGMGTDKAPTSAPPTAQDEATQADKRLKGMFQGTGGIYGPKPGAQTGSRTNNDFRNMFQPLPAYPPVGGISGPAGYPKTKDSLPVVYDAYEKEGYKIHAGAGRPSDVNIGRSSSSGGDSDNIDTWEQEARQRAAEKAAAADADKEDAGGSGNTASTGFNESMSSYQVNSSSESSEDNPDLRQAGNGAGFDILEWGANVEEELVNEFPGEESAKLDQLYALITEAEEEIANTGTCADKAGAVAEAIFWLGPSIVTDGIADAAFGAACGKIAFALGWVDNAADAGAGIVKLIRKGLQSYDNVAFGGAGGLNVIDRWNDTGIARKFEYQFEGTTYRWNPGGTKHANEVFSNESRKARDPFNVGSAQMKAESRLIDSINAFHRITGREPTKIKGNERFWDYDGWEFKAEVFADEGRIEIFHVLWKGE